MEKEIRISRETLDGIIGLFNPKGAEELRANIIYNDELGYIMTVKEDDYSRISYVAVRTKPFKMFRTKYDTYTIVLVQGKGKIVNDMSVSVYVKYGLRNTCTDKKYSLDLVGLSVHPVAMLIPANWQTLTTVDYIYSLFKSKDGIITFKCSGEQMVAYDVDPTYDEDDAGLLKYRTEIMTAVRNDTEAGKISIVDSRQYMQALACKRDIALDSIRRLVRHALLDAENSPHKEAVDLLVGMRNTRIDMTTKMVKDNMPMTIIMWITNPKIRDSACTIVWVTHATPYLSTIHDVWEVKIDDSTVVVDAVKSIGMTEIIRGRVQHVETNQLYQIDAIGDNMHTCKFDPKTFVKSHVDPKDPVHEMLLANLKTVINDMDEYVSTIDDGNEDDKKAAEEYVEYLRSLDTE